MTSELIGYWDIEIAARTVYGEARGEGYTGMKAVAHVLINRWKSTEGQFRKDDTLATACLRHVQFSIWTPGDPNFEKIHTVTDADPAFRACKQALIEALDSSIDPTKGSTHYHTKAISPYWVEGHTPAAEIGNHLFYNTVR